MTDRDSENNCHVTNHVTGGIFHWCSSSSDTSWDPQIFLCKYSKGMLKEPFPDDLICLRYCWDCVHEYHQERQTYVELNQDQTEWILFSFECTVLKDSLEDVKQELVRKKAGGSKSKNAKKSIGHNFVDQTRHLPIVLQEILKYPFFFFMKDIHDLFIEVLKEVFTLYGKNQNVPQFPGIYLLLVHPDDQVRNWAEQKVVDFDPIQLADCSDLLQVVSIVFSVLKFGIQDDPSVCDEVTTDEPSRRVIISSYQFNMEVYWQGLHNLLNHMDSELVNNIKEEIPQNILNSVLQASKSEDSEKSFLLKLSCFVVLLKSSKESLWLKVQDPQDYVFISIIRCQVWKSLLKKISRKSTTNPAELCQHFTWVLPWAKSLSGSQGARATDIDYSITYVYHVQGYIQHRHYHNLPTSLPYKMCQGKQKCKFYDMKKSRANKSLTSVVSQPTESQKAAQQVLNDILRQLYICRKRLPKQFSSQGMKKEEAGFLGYKSIKRLVLDLYQKTSPWANVLDEDEISLESDTDESQASDDGVRNTMEDSQNTAINFHGENKTTPLDIKQPKVVLKPITKSNGLHSSEAASSGSSDVGASESKSRFKFKSKVSSRASDSISRPEKSSHEKVKQVSSEKAKSTPSAPSPWVKLDDVIRDNLPPTPERSEDDEDNTQNIFDIMSKVRNGTTSTIQKNDRTKLSNSSLGKTKIVASPEPLAEQTSKGPWRRLTEATAGHHSSTTVLLDEDGQPTESTLQKLNIRPCSVRLTLFQDHRMRTPKRTLAWDSDSDSSDFVSFKKRSKRLPSDDESSCSDMITAVDSGKESRKDQMQEKEEHTLGEEHDSRLQDSAQSDSDLELPNVFKEDATMQALKKAGDSGRVRGRESPLSAGEKGSDIERVEDAEVILISSSDDEQDFVKVRRRKLKKKNAVIVVSDGEEDEEDSDKNRGFNKSAKEGSLGPPVVIKDIEMKETKVKVTLVKKEDSESMEIDEGTERTEEAKVKSKVDKRMDYKESRTKLDEDNKGKEYKGSKMKIEDKRTDKKEATIRGDDEERTDFKSTKRKGKCDATNCKACQGQGGKHVIQNFRKEDTHRGRKDEETDDGEKRLASSVKTSPALVDQISEEHSGREKNMRDELSENSGKVSLDSEDGKVGEKSETDGKGNSFLTKYTIVFNEEESCMDSDAETDDGSPTDEKEEGISSPVFDLIDEMEDEPTLTQLDRMEKEVKVEEDGNISDGLDLDEIIDITESMTENDIEIEDEKVFENKEKSTSRYVDFWNESCSEAPLVISESPVKIQPLTENEMRGGSDKGKALGDKNVVDVSEMASIEKTKRKSNGGAKEAVKQDNILLGFLEGGLTEEEDGDEDDGWVDEGSSWEVGDDGWLKGDDEEEPEGEDDEMEEEEDDGAMCSQGFQVSTTNLVVTPSLVQRISTGVTGTKSGASSKSPVKEEEKGKQTFLNQTKTLGQASKPVKKDTVPTKDGFHSKSFYRHHLPSKKPARRKKQQKRKPVNYAAVKQKMAEKRVLDAAVPLGNRSLVTGQISKGRMGHEELSDPQSLSKEPTTPTTENVEIRLAPPIKSAHRSRRSESLLESLKQAENQNNSKPKWVPSKGLSASMSQSGAKYSENSSSLSNSFTAGVTNKEKENQRNKADTRKNGDLLSSIMEGTTRTLKEMSQNHFIRPRAEKTPACSVKMQQEACSGDSVAKKDHQPRTTALVSAMKSGYNPSPQDSSKKDPSRNQKRSVHFADAVSFAPAHSSHLPNKTSVSTNSDKQRIHPRPIVSYDSVFDPETAGISSGGGHRGFSRQMSDPARSSSELPSSTDNRPSLFESSGRKVPQLQPSKPLTRDQFIGWILGWKVGHMDDKIDDIMKILKGCDSYNTLKEVPNSFSSVDEFYKTFIPLKMIQIWEKLQSIYAEIGNNRTSIAVLTKSMQAKFEDQLYKICDFKVSLTQTSSKSKPMVYPQRSDLVIVGPESSYSFVPVFGYVDEVQSFQSAGFYSSNSSQQLVLRIRVFGDVDFKAHTVKLQVMTSLGTYIQQFQAFMSLEKSALSSNILNPIRKDVFGEGQSSPVVENILKDILKQQQQNYRPPQPKPISVTKEQENFIKTAFHCLQQSYGIPRVCMLQGPPCSGKTLALIQLVTCLLRHSSKQASVPQSTSPHTSKPKILLCAPSDTAVDVLTGRLWKMVRHFKEEGIKHNTPLALPYFILRLGNATDVNKKYKDFVLENIIGSVTARKDQELKKLKTRKGELQMQEQSLEGHIQARSSLIKKSAQIEKLRKEKMMVRNERKVVEGMLMKEQKEAFKPELIKQDVLNKADVILCKLSDISSPDLQNLLRLPPSNPCVLRFSCAIIDEACQGLEVDTLLPLYSGITKLVLAGDSHELKPDSFRLIPDKFKLTQSLFTRLWMNFQESTSQPVLTLTEQHGCHPEIYSFPNKTFYNKRISSKRKENLNTPLVPYLVFNLTDGKQKASETGGWSNEAELDLIQCIVGIINQQKLPEIGLAIISPYPEQIKQIKERIYIQNGWYVGDIDGLQGRMKDIVIISCVQTEVMSSKDSSFLHNHSKLNVALTRGSYAVFVIGNFNVLPRINTLWSNLSKDATHRDLFVNIVRKDFVKKLAQMCLVREYKNWREKVIQRRQNGNSQGWT
ncbi:putative helicase senataxin [Holothuria leucospilota]|uniref:Helicase senataxin n=1 Tax=Holothuria leucospilota TaxID=206669 RepID=A0A9Q1H1P6_HOLLE|nr:putative helicase senataxin [Holothuria leucospilota]